MKYNEFNPTKEEIKRYPHFKNATKCWKNETYEILLNKTGKYTHLKVHRIDDDPIHNYLDLQEIKNNLLGKEVIAIEIYPKESDLKNGSNTYHLWTWDGIEMPYLANIPRYH